MNRFSLPFGRMNAVLCPMDAMPAVSGKPPVPFAAVYVTLTKQEHIRLVMEANSWKSLHRKATERAEWNERRHQHELLKLKLQAAQCETALRAELELAHAKVRNLLQASVWPQERVPRRRQ